MPLDELVNQARPARRRPATYGRRKPPTVASRELHRQLFGTDENAVEQGLQKLSVEDPTGSDSITGAPPLSRTRTPEKPPTKALKPPKPRCENRQTQPSAPNGASESGSRTKLRNKPKRTGKRKMGTLSEYEKGELAPVLSLEGVHSTVQNFTDFANSLLLEFNVNKAHEGAFSECFILTRIDDPTVTSVFKVIPFDFRKEGEKGNRTGSNSSEPQPEQIHTNVSALLREFRILKSLESQHGFAQIRSMRIVRGQWHPQLLQAYEQFKVDNPIRAINPSPDKRWRKDQIYGVVEMVSAGNDLDTFKKPTACQAYDAFWMTVSYLAMAEQKLEFEHRDMHMSNLCYKLPSSTSSSFRSSFESTASNVSTASTPLLGQSGLQITVIDYNLSRMRLEDGEVLSTAPENYGMPGSAFGQEWAGNKQHDWVLEHGGGDWAAFSPKTNVIWLAHLLDELLKRGKDKSGAWRAVLDEDFEVWEKLKAVKGALGVLEAAEMPESAEALWELGLGSNWITVEDEKALKERLNADS